MTFDNMVIKQRFLDQAPEQYNGAWRRDLAIEAVIQSQLSSMESSENINSLRKYKYYPSQEPEFGTARLYMEYAKWGNLEVLLDRYRAWDKYLPELFLWHTFIGLARAIDLMRRCPTQWQPTTLDDVEAAEVDDELTDEIKQRDFILHGDLKTANVVLGKRTRFEFECPSVYTIPNEEESETDVSAGDESTSSASEEEETERRGGLGQFRRRTSSATSLPEDYQTDNEEEDHPANLPKYPTIQLIDFGYSRRTRRGDPKNPWEVREVGTLLWNSPEQNLMGHYENPPLHRYHSRNYLINEKQNVWGVGLIMHDLMTLARPGDVCDFMGDMDGDWQRTYLRPVGPRGHREPLRHFSETFRTQHRPEYSLGLRRLIWRCVRPCRSYRPSSSRLVALVEAGLKNYLKTLKVRGRHNRGPDPQHTLQLTVEDFNKIKIRGEAKRKVDVNSDNDIEEWECLLDNRYADIDEPALQPPKKKWKDFYELKDPKPTWPTDFQGEPWEAVGEKIVFKQNPRHQRKKHRVVSWDPFSQSDIVFRNKLSMMAAALRGNARKQPIQLLEYVLNKEKDDEVEALEKLRWICGNLQNPTWRWLQDRDLQWRANAANVRLPERTPNECMYFVATADRGPGQVDQAVQDMKTVFG
jgi:serine/threonine protein kinase